MAMESPLKGKTILLVDDEPDVLDTLADLLDISILHKAGDYDTAITYLTNNSYDAVVLDIMGVNGFGLLKISDARGFPTVMLTAYSVSPEALKKSIEMGAVSFIPKDKMYQLKEFLEEIVSGGGKRFWWRKSFDRMGAYFETRFGPGWKEKDKFFKEFEKSLNRDEDDS